MSAQQAPKPVKFPDHVRLPKAPVCVGCQAVLLASYYVQKAICFECANGPGATS